MQDDHDVVDDNVEADIFVRGPTIMQGYLRNPEATSDAIDADGWLKTGDIAFKSEGKLYIVGREKVRCPTVLPTCKCVTNQPSVPQEMIKVRGWQISPAELEAQLIQHPSVADAAVIGVPSRSLDEEVPRAYLVEAHGEKVTEHEIKKYMSTHLAKYKSLDGGVRTIDAIPKNSTGKILRKVLRDHAAAERGSNASLASAANDSLCANTPMSQMSLSPSPSEHDLSRNTSSSDGSSLNAYLPLEIKQERIQP